MRKALFISKNLVGDALNIGPALQAWHHDHPEFDHIDLFTLPDQVATVYTHMGIPFKNILTMEPDPKDYEFFFNFDVGKAFTIGERTHKHLTACYALMLGVDIGDNRKPIYVPDEEEHESGLVLLSLFSKSCSSNQGLPPNKMLPWDKVAPLIELLRQFGPLGILGAGGDRMPLFKNYDHNVIESEYYTGLPLNQVALMLRDCKALFTIDNGISHLAASQETRCVVFYPACLDPRWIAPLGNKNAIIIHGDPVTVNVPGLLKVVRETMKGWNL